MSASDKERYVSGATVGVTSRQTRSSESVSEFERRQTMPGGDKSKYTDKADHSVPETEAERRAIGHGGAAHL
jgi:hypothetical protein